MTNPVFVDSNIPMYAHGSDHPYKIPCQEALKKIAYENIPAIISSEIIQEIIYRYLSLKRPEQALQVARDVMTIIPEVLPVTENDVRRALTLISEYSSLKARDLIHVAVMVENGISIILSADTHFDQVRGLDRIDPQNFIKT